MEQTTIPQPEDITLADILSAVNGFANNIEERFNKFKESQEKLEKNVNQIKTQMVTKDYLDDKLSELKGDSTSLTRKEDRKLTTLVELLAEREIINNKDAWSILAMEPFSHSTGNS